MNLGGPWGAHLADLLLQVFGFAGYLFPLLVLSAGWKLIRSAEVRTPWAAIIGWTLLAASVSAAFGMMPSWRPIGKVLPAGGLIGMLLADSLVARVSDAGAILIVLVCGLLSLYLISSFSLENLRGLIEVPALWIGNLVSRFRDWRVASAKRSQERAAARKAEAKTQAKLQKEQMLQQRASLSAQQELQQLQRSVDQPPVAAPATAVSGLDRFSHEDDEEPPFDAFQSAKGLCVAVALLCVFLFTGWPREVAALVGAGVLLLSRRLHSAQVMGYVDWQLLLLFIGLFVVNHAFEGTGLAADAVAWLAAHGVQLSEPGPLLVVGVALSNLVSNVPAVMLMLPHLQGPTAATMLALVSTFAGNLLLVGSIANLIVADLARQSGIGIDWKQHARIGVPVTLGTLVLVWFWLGWAA